MLYNRISLLEEKIEGIHIYLDCRGIPRLNEEGQEYSIVGRINLLETKMLKDFSDRESELLKNNGTNSKQS